MTVQPEVIIIFLLHTGSTSFLYHFSATRWVKSKDFAEKTKSFWEHVVKIVNFWKKLPKSKQPICDS